MVWFCTEKVQQIYNLIKHMPNLRLQESIGDVMINVRVGNASNVCVRRSCTAFWPCDEYVLLTPEQFMKKIIELSQGGNNV